jgi:signal transduction histidine kinase
MCTKKQYGGHIRVFTVGSQFAHCYIDRGEAEAVFDPFYRVESDNVKRVPGTGLGLHVARTIVRQHGGDITIVPGETSGSTLRITLPLEARG